MRYLTSISLALVVLMALACSSEPATPAGPMYSEEEAVAILKEHLQTKMFPGEPYPCLLVIEDTISDPNSVTWSANYDSEGRRWDISVGEQSVKSLLLGGTPEPSSERYTWSVYERTKSIVATGDDPINQMC